MVESRQLALPAGFERLPRLRHLVLACPRLARLPENVGELSQLRSLELDQCTELRAIPESVGMLGRLSMLAVGSGLGSVQEQSWLALASLRTLVIRRYAGPVIPAAILALTQIQELYRVHQPGHPAAAAGAGGPAVAGAAGAARLPGAQGAPLVRGAPAGAHVPARAGVPQPAGPAQQRVRPEARARRAPLLARQRHAAARLHGRHGGPPASSTSPAWPRSSACLPTWACSRASPC